MARQKEFDRDQAVKTALLVFRKQGFAATSTDDLRLAMGIGRQSFYDTFKGKKELYAETLRLYAAERFSVFAEQFRSSKSPLKAIENILSTLPNESAKERQLSCLGVASVCEFGSSDEQISEINQNAGTTLVSFLSKLIREAQEKGEIKENLNPELVASYLLTLLNGLRVSARAGSAPQDLHKTIKVAIEGLKAT